MEQFINIPHSTPQSSILGIFDNIQHSGLINHLLLIFKCYIYSGRNTKQLNFDNLKITIKKIKEIEKELTNSNKRKLLKKWHPIDQMIDWYCVQNKEGVRWKRVISSRFLFYYFSCLFFFFFLFCFVLFFCLLKKNCPVLSCFINFIFNSFIIRYWMYFVVIERKKN